MVELERYVFKLTISIIEYPTSCHANIPNDVCIIKLSTKTRLSDQFSTARSIMRTKDYGNEEVSSGLKSTKRFEKACLRLRIDIYMTCRQECHAQLSHVQPHFPQIFDEMEVIRGFCEEIWSDSGTRQLLTNSPPWVPSSFRNGYFAESAVPE
ncbi:uncharacterized protein RCC_01658 [Ramularia collo-cygni]|uniref:Uncharacterized protein n=1 Tax=Ramularia collo-cygni TaxID=112498 RepID=A0A2D3UM02_9PEZI|nr:uncharacterized protein RCC_01658 [Ramularia collo-cygni]CZT15822.1 uncharacterized protein RCC_01658 [Ramularia collo-cygni]